MVSRHADANSERHAAPVLLQRVIREHADDQLQAAMAWADLGRFYAEDGEHELAADALRSCLDAEAALDGGGLHTGSELALAEVIVSAGWRDRYPETLDLLEADERAGLTFRSSAGAGLSPGPGSPGVPDALPRQDRSPLRRSPSSTIRLVTSRGIQKLA